MCGIICAMNKQSLSMRQSSESAAKFTFASVRHFDGRARVNALRTAILAMAKLHTGNKREPRNAAIAAQNS